VTENIFEPPSEEWRRTERRLPIDLGSTPFLGSRENGQPTFAYLLRDVSPSGVGMIIPPKQGMVPLEVGEWINFHLPFQLNEKFYNQGLIRWQQNVPKGQMCGAHLERRVPLKYPIYVGFETGQVHFIIEEFGIQSLEALTERILEDAYYFKRGLAIYFEHLAPYFKRHSLPMLHKGLHTDETVVPRIRALIAQHIQMIERLLALSRTGERSFPDQADLETLRSAVDYELNITVLSETFDASTVRPYLRSLHLLRHQLFSNFNTLVLVHQHRSKETRKAIKA
jgi:PilZ domain